VLRVDLQRRLVPFRRFLEAPRVEVHVGQLHARHRVGRVLLRRQLHRRGARLVERRRRGLAAAGLRRRRGGHGRRRRAVASLLAADDPPHQHPEEHAGHAHDESISRHDEPRSYVLTLPIPNYATPNSQPTPKTQLPKLPSPKYLDWEPPCWELLLDFGS